MGRIFPFLIFVLLLGLAAYAGVQTFSLIKKSPEIAVQTTPVPTEPPLITLFPTPTPNPGINSYLQTHILNSSSTCVHQYIGQDNDNYYLWAICRNPSASISIPVAVKINLMSHKTPGAGESYDSDLIRIFPESIRSHEIFSNPTLLETLQSQLP